MKILAIAGTDLRRMSRTGVSLALALVLPLLLVFIEGLANQTAEARIGLVVEDDGPFAVQLAESIRGIDEITTRDLDREEMLAAVNRSDLVAGVVIPPGYDATLRSGAAAVEYHSFAGVPPGSDVYGLIDAEVAALAAELRAASCAVAETGTAFDDALAAATTGATAIAGTDGGPPAEPIGAFDPRALSYTLMFVFITAIASSNLLVEARELGVSQRMLSTPTRTGTVIGGVALGRLLVSAVQTTIIVVLSALVFQVDWGGPPAAIAIVAVFALVGAGAGLLAGRCSRAKRWPTAWALASALGWPSARRSRSSRRSAPTAGPTRPSPRSCRAARPSATSPRSSACWR